MSTVRQHNNPDVARSQSNIVHITIFPANKGLTSSIPSPLLEHEQLSTSRNLIHTTHGSRKSRPGVLSYYVSGFGSGGQIQGLQDFWRTTGSTKTQKVIAVTDGKIFADSADGVFTDVWSPNTSFSTTAKTSIDTLVGLAIIGVEGRAPIKYNQSGLATDLGGTPPNGWMIRRHRSSIWIAGDASNPELLSKSDTENPEEWALGTADTFNIDLGAGDPYGITGISPSIYGRIYVGKWNAIHEIQTDTIGSFVVPITESIGFASHNSIVSTGNDIVFASKRGVHSLKTTQNYGDVESTFMSFPVQNIWDDQVDFERNQEISAAYIPEYNSYLVAYPRRGKSTFDLLGFNLVTGDIFHWEAYNAAFLTSFQDSRKRTRLMIGTLDANIGLGRLANESSFLDFLGAFGSGFKTGNIFPTYQPASVWQFKNLTVFYKPQGSRPIQVAYKIDNIDQGEVEFAQAGTGGALLGAFILSEDLLGGVSGSYTQTTRELTGYGNSIQLDFSVEPETPTEDAGMEIYGYEIECEQVGDSSIPVAIS